MFTFICVSVLIYLYQIPRYLGRLNELLARNPVISLHTLSTISSFNLLCVCRQSDAPLPATCSRPSSAQWLDAPAFYTPFYTSLLVCINFVPGTLSYWLLPLPLTLSLSYFACATARDAAFLLPLVAAPTPLFSVFAFCNCWFLAQVAHYRSKQPVAANKCL